MESLGLRIDGDQIVAALGSDDGQAETRTVNLEQVDELSDWVARAGNRIAAVFPAGLIGRRLQFPFTQARKIRQVLTIQLDELVPGDLEDYERRTRITKADGVGIAQSTLLARETLAEVRQKLLAITPEARLLTPEALLVAARDQRPATDALVWATPTATTVVAPGAGQDFVFTVPIGTAHLTEHQGVINLVNRIRSGLQSDVTTWHVDGWHSDALSPESIADLLPDGVSVIQHSSPDQQPPPERLALMAAQAAAGQGRGYWNLAPRGALISGGILSNAKVRKAALPTAIAAILLIVVVQSGTGRLEAQTAATRNEVKKVFLRNFPDSRAVDPIRQMRSVVDRAGGASSAGADLGSVIDNLKSFHSAVSSDSTIDVDEIRASKGVWTVKGEAGDFAAVDELKKSLEGLPWTDEVRVQRAEQTVDKSAIRYSVTWKEKQS